jgi:phosphatidylglycerophosphate synthase
MTATSVVAPPRSSLSLAADLCTLLRIVLAPLFAWTLAATKQEGSIVPLAIFLTGAATDFADGRLARGAGSDTRRGRVFDHCADALFLFPALVVLASTKRLSVLVPAAAILAFGLYCGDGWRRGRPAGRIELRPSRPGAAAGVANYLVTGAAAVALWAGCTRLDQAVYALGLATAALNAGAALARVASMLVSPLPRAAEVMGERDSPPEP